MQLARLNTLQCEPPIPDLKQCRLLDNPVVVWRGERSRIQCRPMSHARPVRRDPSQGFDFRSSDE